jgi:drug/metabolite transporter (DMT)-like permease
VLVLVFGVFACSTAVIMIKARPGTLDPVLLAALRLFVAAIALTPLMLRDLRRFPGRLGRRQLAATLLPGLLLGAHFVSWIIGVGYTKAVNASLIVNMVPVVMPLLMFALVRERVTAGELLATAIAMGGVALLGWTDFDASPQYLLGDAICFGSMLLMAVYLALGRRNRAFASLWLYMVPLYWTAGVLCFLASLFFVNPFRAYSPLEIGLILGLGLVPTVMGHSILNYSMKHLRGQVVSILNLGQFVLAGVMAYFIYAESPSWSLYVAGGVTVAAAVVVLRLHRAE